MKLSEKIRNEVAKHARPGTLPCYRDVYCKFRLLCTYEHFKDYALQDGVILPRSWEQLRDCEIEKPQQRETLVSLASKFASRKGMFNRDELYFYLVGLRRNTEPNSIGSVLTTLIKTGHVVRVRKSVYQSIAG